ncbi:MAG: type VI secretion system baseplate subunit TssK [Janthinobacterium lividum]
MMDGRQDANERLRGDLQLRSVNWEHGMLLTPDHFLRQEQYLESLQAWGMRYLAQGTGLVGGGVRLPEADLGTIRFDPEVSLNETAEYLDVSVNRARGVTPIGSIVDVESAGTVSVRYPKGELAGVVEALIHVVIDPDAREKRNGVPDSFNPQMRTERVPSYRVALQVTAAERAHSIVVGRLRRPATGMSFEADPQFVPACISVAAHSELMSGTRRILDATNRLAAGYAELHRAMREFMQIFTERGLETEVDRDSMVFAERMVLELQDTAYALLDRTQSPGQFFGRVRRMLHSAAIYFDLAEGMQQYYDTLRETGESELVGLIELQKHTLQLGRTLQLDEDLGMEVRKALQSLGGLERLERALEGKYIDFRKSATLESTNFIFDRGGKSLYRLSARASRVQGVADEMTIFFSNLRLEGRDRYRLILVGDRATPWLRGTSIGAEVRLNEGSGFRRESYILTGDVKLDEQYNIELDFEAPDVPTITDVRVTVPAYHTVRTALLFIRHRFYSNSRQETQEVRTIEREPERPLQEPPAPSAFNAGRTSFPEPPRGFADSSNNRLSPDNAMRRSTFTPVERTPDRVEPPPAPPAAQPSWMPREAPPSNPDPNDPNRPRRRSRLE